MGQEGRQRTERLAAVGLDCTGSLRAGRCKGLEVFGAGVQSLAGRRLGQARTGRRRLVERQRDRVAPEAPCSTKLSAALTSSSRFSTRSAPSRSAR